MRDRLGLHEKLVETLGSNKVYYQPPETLKLVYPCIVYSLETINTSYADDMNYKREKSYLVTLIHKDPENDIVDKLLDLEMSSFDRHYTSDNLHHFVFTIFY